LTNIDNSRVRSKQLSNGYLTRDILVLGSEEDKRVLWRKNWQYSKWVPCWRK